MHNGELLKNTHTISCDKVESSIEVNKKEINDVYCPDFLCEEKINTSYGTLFHFEYDSISVGCERSANILLPKNYSEDRKYPVLYFLHGIFGDENSMIGDSNNRIKEIIGNLKSLGFIEDIIVVFPNMYATSDKSLKPGFTDKQAAPYDYFIFDLVQDLIPYIDSNYSTKADRLSRALIGFSMGGRESLFIGLNKTDLFGYIGAIAPAPGLVSTKDWAMEHPGQLSESEVVIKQPEFIPELLMVCCGTKDSVVGNYPKSYHDILTRNNVEHLWYEVPEADHDSNAIRSGLFNLLIRWFAK